MRTTLRSHRGRGLTPVLFFIIALGLVLFAALVLFREPLSALLVRAYAPILELRNAFSRDEASRLRAELAGLQALLVDRAVLYEENLHLKRLLGRNAERSLLLAGVIMRPPGTPYDTVLIDAGGLDGVVEGQYVSAGGNALIGRVVQVYEHAARVMLFSAPGELHEGLLSRDGTTVPLTIEGQGGGSLKAEVPIGTGAQVGDSILISGIGSGITAMVAEVVVGESESYESLYLRLPANPYHLRTVEVWRAAGAL